MLAVKRVGGVPTVFPADSGEVAPDEDMLQLVYDCGPVPGLAWEDFDGLRARVAAEWAALPRAADNYSASLKAKIAALRQDMHSSGGAAGAAAAAAGGGGA